jgi:hypothetical protein
MQAISVADTYEEWDLSAVVPSNARSVVWHCHDGTGVDAGVIEMNARAQGQSWGGTAGINYPKGNWITALNPTNRKIEQKCSSDSRNGYIYGYMTEASPPAGEIVITRYNDIE